MNNHSFCFQGTHNQNIQIYDVATLKHMYSLNGHIGIVTVLKVVESPSGSFMFSGSSDASVQVSCAQSTRFLFSTHASLVGVTLKSYSTCSVKCLHQLKCTATLIQLPSVNSIVIKHLLHVHVQKLWGK